MQRRASVIAALVSAACFGTLAIFTSVAYANGAEPLQLLTWRFSLAAVLLGGYLMITRPGALKVPLGDVGRYAVVLAERVFFAVPLSSGRGIAVLLTFAGCALVSDPFSAQGGVAVIGIGLGLGAAACYAAFSMLSDRWLEGRPRTTLMAYLFVFTALLSGVAAVLSGASLAVADWSGVVWLMLAGIVVFPTFIAILLYLRAVRGLGAGQAAILSTFEPVFTIVLAAAILGEQLSVVQWCGAALVLLGVFIAERAGRPAEELALV